MTIQQLIDAAAAHSVLLLVWFCLVPVLCYLVGVVLGSERATGSPGKYLYSVLVYLACVPGIGALVLTAYSIFLIKKNLLEVDIFVHLLPIVSMVMALALIRKRIDFDDIPGFHRLSGLMCLIGVTFGVVLAIDRTHIGVWFIGSFGRLLVLIAVVFAVLKWSTGAVFRGGREAKLPFPKFPKS